MNRLESALSGGGALVPYLTAFDPSPEAFLESALGCVDGGAAVLEVGVPFSDPVADGPAIQAAHARALAAGAGAWGVLDLVRSLRRAAGVPVVLFSYVNPILAAGPDRFLGAAADAGADGLLVLDCPPEEEPAFHDAVRAHGLSSILLVGPTTSEARTARLASAAEGFVYLLSRAGITGVEGGGFVDVERRAADLRRFTSLPLAAGFGVKTRGDASRLWASCEGVVVGSALVAELAARPAGKRREAAAAFVRDLLGGRRPVDAVVPDHSAIPREAAP